MEKASTPLFAYLIDNAEESQKESPDGIESSCINAGASAPEVLVQSVVDRLKEWGGEVPEELQGQEENVVFSLPKELRLVEVD